MARQPSVYVRLQKHLDRHPVGFPATAAGAEIALLKHIFSPEEAAVATCMDYRPETPEVIFQRAGHLVASVERLETILEGMLKNGGIELRVIAGRRHYCNAPLVVGMYEFQSHRLTPGFLADFNAYTGDRRFGLSFLSVRPPQMRTIPVGRSLHPRHRTLPFDAVASLVAAAEAPFVVVPCICRSKEAMAGRTCDVTDRKENCIAMGSLAQQAKITEMGREISRQQALDILEANQKEGLVLQPSNTRQPDFICSCCGCCCGMLRLQQALPKPLDYWAGNYQAVVDPAACKGCGTCRDWCQVGAISGGEKKTVAVIERDRCIGCGLCVANCPATAVSLTQRPVAVTPPEDRDALLEAIKANRRGPIGRLRVAGKLVLDAFRTGRTDLLK